jgi:hypothetical protein
MEKYFKIEFSKGGIFKAKLLEDSAPKTCKNILDSLPFSCSVLTALNGSFSGQILYPTKIFTYNEVENPVVFGVQSGDIFLNTNANKSTFDNEFIPPRVMIAYSSSVILWNWAGWQPSNHFARIMEGDLRELFQIGRRIKWDGKEDVTCSVI